MSNYHAQGSGTVFDSSGSPRPVKYAFVNASAAGVSPLVAAVGSGIKIRVLSLTAVVKTASDIKFQSNANDVSAAYPLTDNGGMVLGFNKHGWFETAPSEGLNLSMSLSSMCGCNITYIETT